MEATIDPLVELRNSRNKAAKPLLYVAISSMVMLFAAFTSAYIVSQSGGNWLHFDVPKMFYVSTIILIVSSGTIYFSLHRIKKGDKNGLKNGLLITLLLGIGFIVTQLMGWSQLTADGIVFAGSKSNPAGSYLYALTGLHILHLIGGIFSLGFTYVKAILGKYDANNTQGVELCNIYWHFLDILWMYLLLFLIFIN